MTPVDRCDVAIIGGGPAGLAAAIVARRHDLKVCLIDEQPRLGGQIYRQPPAGFRVRSWLAGRVYRSGKSLLERAERLTGVHHLPQATVWGLFPSEPPADREPCHHVHIECAGEMRLLKARYVLVAAGCYEMPVPFPGWHLPGVMSAGAIQTLLKSQRIAAGRRVVLAGSHPLLLIAADQLLEAGVTVAAVLFSQPLRTMAGALRRPGTLISGYPQLLHAAQCLSRLRRARVPLLTGQVVSEALGDDSLEAVRIGRSDFTGHPQEIACETLGMCYGFLASSELARQAGARALWQPGSGWILATDELLRTSMANLSVAGELTGVAGAEAAALSGEIAALGIAADTGRLTEREALAQSATLRRNLSKLRRFAAMIAQISSPPPRLLSRLATPETLLCRCEEITVGALEEELRANPSIDSASGAKLLTRVGMGTCQGRMCELTVRHLVGQSRGCALEHVAGFTPRPPVKPIPLAALAAEARGSTAESRHPVA